MLATFCTFVCVIFVCISLCVCVCVCDWQISVFYAQSKFLKMPKMENMRVAGQVKCECNKKISIKNPLAFDFSPANAMCCCGYCVCVVCVCLWCWFLCSFAYGIRYTKKTFLFVRLSHVLWLYNLLGLKVVIDVADVVIIVTVACFRHRCLNCAIC